MELLITYAWCFLMKDDYDAVSAEIGAWLLCRVTSSRLFAGKLLLIVMLPLRARCRPSHPEKAAVQAIKLPMACLKLEPGTFFEISLDAKVDL